MVSSGQIPDESGEVDVEEDTDDESQGRSRSRSTSTVRGKPKEGTKATMKTTTPAPTPKKLPNPAPKSKGPERDLDRMEVGLRLRKLYSIAVGLPSTCDRLPPRKAMLSKLKEKGKRWRFPKNVDLDMLYTRKIQGHHEAIAAAVAAGSIIIEDCRPSENEELEASESRSSPPPATFQSPLQSGKRGRGNTSVIERASKRRRIVPDEDESDDPPSENVGDADADGNGEIWGGGEMEDGESTDVVGGLLDGEDGDVSGGVEVDDVQGVDDARRELDVEEHTGAEDIYSSDSDSSNSSAEKYVEEDYSDEESDDPDAKRLRRRGLQEEYPDVDQTDYY